MSGLNRRDLIKLCGGGLLASGFTPLSNTLRASFAPSLASSSNERVFTIFLRGAMDALHSIVPIGDPSYFASRGSLKVKAADRLRLSSPNPFATLNRSLMALGGDPTDVNSPDELQKIAWIMNCGNPHGRRSHFDEQQVYETAWAPPTVAEAYVEEGFMPRLSNAAGFGGAVPAASVSPRMQRMFRSADPNLQGGLLAHVRSLDAYSFSVSGSQIGTRIGRALNSQVGQTSGTGIDRYVDDTNQFVVSSLAEVAGVTVNHDPNAFPVDSVEADVAAQFYGRPQLFRPDYVPGHRFMRECEEALALLLQADDCRAVGVEIGGWDTHVNQADRRAPLDSWLAHAIRSIFDAIMNPSAPPTTLLVFGEFGRTNRVNASGGTDHGVGGLMMALGPNVRGDVYNCHDGAGAGLGAPWTNLDADVPGPTQNAQPVETDFRTVLAELFDKRFGLNSTDLTAVIPRWNVLAGSDSRYDYLDVFLP